MFSPEFFVPVYLSKQFLVNCFSLHFLNSLGEFINRTSAGVASSCPGPHMPKASPRTIQGWSLLPLAALHPPPPAENFTFHHMAVAAQMRLPHVPAPAPLPAGSLGQADPCAGCDLPYYKGTCNSSCQALQKQYGHQVKSCFQAHPRVAGTRSSASGSKTFDACTPAWLRREANASWFCRG